MARSGEGVGGNRKNYFKCYSFGKKDGGAGEGPKKLLAGGKLAGGKLAGGKLAGGKLAGGLGGGTKKGGWPVPSQPPVFRNRVAAPHGIFTSSPLSLVPGGQPKQSPKRPTERNPRKLRSNKSTLLRKLQVFFKKNRGWGGWGLFSKSLEFSVK
jgi:hypothetical protein